MTTEKDKEKKRLSNARWRAKNKDRIRRYNIAYYATHKKEIYEWHARPENRAKQIVRSALWVRTHQERAKKNYANFRRRNPGYNTRRATAYKAAKRGHTPAWANSFFVDEIYGLASLRTKITGFKWEVDHIVPLQSKLVCGLHCERNLRVIPKSQNQRKGNHTWPDMPDKNAASRPLALL